MSAWRSRLEAQLAAVLAELEEARGRVASLEDRADDLQRRLADGEEHSDDDVTEYYSSGSDSDGGESDEGGSSDSESGEPPELPDRLDDPEGDDEEAPAQPDVTEEDRAEEAKLSTELGMDMGKLCDDVAAHIKPVEHKLCFEARKYVRTLAAAALRSRRVRDSGFVYPPEMENLVCGGATQARAPRARALSRSPR